jgi:hypothetical protein
MGLSKEIFEKKNDLFEKGDEISGHDGISVVDFQCCGSGMFIPDPNIFWYPGSGSDHLLSRILDPDPTNKRREK